MPLEPNEFSYKVVTTPKAQITESNLVQAIPLFKDYWDKPTLKRLVNKVGLTRRIISALRNNKNPLVARFSNSDNEAIYCTLNPMTDFDNKYLTPEEYQYFRYSVIPSIFTAENTTNVKSTLLVMYLTILKRYPKTTQSRILIRYINKQLKKDK